MYITLNKYTYIKALLFEQSTLLFADTYRRQYIMVGTGGRGTLFVYAYTRHVTIKKYVTVNALVSITNFIFS